ncbi:MULTISPECIES: protein phosphatase 2C domain-containing protein [unclassified Myxococcus]|uniref:protein phosphatase 2C domain-containing protein n=1 Tax=unclassified Myxococcus TaxID=2648731 RepID=UPI00157B48AD|nr:protein phosphatase 2C domain-containing protein [Myxococcus sp. CA040A]NTX35563.1 protein phosphatase 2C domain-containing protein [Myxococcus sp. CA033]
MRIQIEAMWVQKAGNTPTENEDACAPEQSSTFEGEVLHVAVADGATESLFSGLWARLLAGEFAEGRMGEPSALLQALPGLQRRWHADVGSRDLPWYAREKLLEGAFATLMGVRLEAARGGDAVGTWTALAVGDSCLFQVRGDRLVRSFPLETAASFGSRPFLVSTQSGQNARVGEAVRTEVGDVRPGDILLLMTDALAHWFLSEHERGGAPWLALPTGTSEDLPVSFARFVDGLRTNKVIRNDDVTLLRVTVGA